MLRSFEVANGIRVTDQMRTDFLYWINIQKVQKSRFLNLPFSDQKIAFAFLAQVIVNNKNLIVSPVYSYRALRARSNVLFYF